MKPKPTAAGQGPSEGPWPFVTHRRIRIGGPWLVWGARSARKGLQREVAALETAPVPFWRTAGYNWATGLLFAIGSVLFMFGAGLNLFPGPLLPMGAIDLIFFAGSISSSATGYLQLFQAANAPEPAPALAERLTLRRGLRARPPAPRQGTLPLSRAARQAAS